MPDAEDTGRPTSRCTRPPTAPRSEGVLRLCRVCGERILAVSRVRPAVVRAFPLRLACEVVSRVTAARELRR